MNINTRRLQKPQTTVTCLRRNDQSTVQRPHNFLPHFTRERTVVFMFTPYAKTRFESTTLISFRKYLSIVKSQCRYFLTVTCFLRLLNFMASSLEYTIPFSNSNLLVLCGYLQLAVNTCELQSRLKKNIWNLRLSVLSANS